MKTAVVFRWPDESCEERTMKKVLFLMSVMLVASAAWADDFVYQTNGNWSTAANWTDNSDPTGSGVIPGIADSATVNGGGNLTISSGNWATNCVHVCGPDGGWNNGGAQDATSEWATSGTFNMTGGSLTVGSNGFFAGYGWNSSNKVATAYVNISGGTINATTGWGALAENYSVIWNQTGGNVSMFNNYAFGGSGAGFESAVGQFNITGGVFHQTYHPVNTGVGAVTVTVGGTGTAIFDDVGMGAGATGSIQYILNPGGILEVAQANDKLISGNYLVAPDGYKMTTTTINTNVYDVYTVPEPVTMTLLGLGALMIRRRG
jgi:hypothetical protein